MSDIDGLSLAEPGEPECGAVVGPVWKLDGEFWACQRPAGHQNPATGKPDDHATRDGCWWVPTVGGPPRNPAAR